ncbi:MAG: transporter substrate-binding domain-containing protein, partial [Pseudomonadota bacterium]
MKKIMCALSALIVLSTAVEASAANRAVAPQQRLVRIATDAGYEPFTYLDEDSNLVGFEVDLLKEMCAILDFTCVFRHEGLLFQDLLPLLKEEQADIVFGGMGITRDRLEDFDFLLNYKATKYFFGKKGVSIQNFPEDLSGMKVGVEANTKFVEFVEALSEDLQAKGMEPIEIIELKDTHAVKAAHLAGNIELHPAGQGLIEAWLSEEEFRDYHSTGPELISGFKGEIFGLGDGFALQKGSPLQYEFGKAMQILLHDCRYTQIEKRYLSF